MQKNTRRVWRIVSISLVIVAIVAVAAFYFLKKDLAKPPGESVLKPLLADQLKKMVVESSDSLYRLEFSLFDINTESGTGIIKDLKLIPDSNVYARLTALKKAPNSLMMMQVDSTVISHFSWQKTDQGRKLVIDDIVIQNPSVTIDYKFQPYSDSINIKKEKTILNILKDVMRLSSVQSFTLRNLNLTMINHSDAAKRSTALKHLNIVTKGIDIITAKQNDSSQQERTAMTIQSNRLATPDSLYYLNTENIRYIPETATLTIEKTELAPRLSKTAFYKAVKFRKDRYHFMQNNIICKGVDIDKLIQKQQIHLQTMTVGSAYIEVYTNYEYPKRKPPVRNTLDPHRRLQKLAFDVTIDTLYLHNGTNEYAIKADKSDDVAVLKIDKAENTIINITNNAEAKKRNHFTTSTMTGRLMDGGRITSTMRFNLSDKDGSFTVSSSIGAMDGKMFNPLVKPLALMEIQSLDVQKMNATINGNAYKGSGNIDFYYKNMKMAFVKKKDDDTYKKKKLLSFVSNLFVPDDNPNKRGKFKKGPINVKRDATDSFFGFLWKCNLAGMTVHMTGLDKEK